MPAVLVSSLLRGYIDEFALENRSAHLRGWIFHEDSAIARINVRLQGAAWINQIELRDRRDIRDAYEPLIGLRPHVGRSGFEITAPPPVAVREPANTLVEIIPYTSQGRRLDSLLTHFCPADQQLANSLPPPALQERVGGSKDFIPIGGQLATHVMTCVGKYNQIFSPAMF